MPDDVLEHDDDHDDAPDPSDSPAIKRIREENRRLAREKRDLEAKFKDVDVDSLRRENAFLKAGIDLTHKGAEYFLNGYKGELTTEAIRAEAEAAGFLATGKPTERSNAQDEQRKQLDDEAARWERSSSTGRDPGQDADFDRANAELIAKNPTQAEYREHLKRWGRLASDDD